MGKMQLYIGKGHVVFSRAVLFILAQSRENLSWRLGINSSIPSSIAYAIPPFCVGILFRLNGLIYVNNVVMKKNSFILVLLISELLISQLSLLALFYTENPAYLPAFVISAAGALYAAYSLKKMHPDLLQNPTNHYHFVCISQPKLIPFEKRPFNPRW